MPARRFLVVLLVACIGSAPLSPWAVVANVLARSGGDAAPGDVMPAAPAASGVTGAIGVPSAAAEVNTTFSRIGHHQDQRSLALPLPCVSIEPPPLVAARHIQILAPQLPHGRAWVEQPCARGPPLS